MLKTASFPTYYYLFLKFRRSSRDLIRIKFLGLKCIIIWLVDAAFFKSTSEMYPITKPDAQESQHVSTTDLAAYSSLAFTFVTVPLPLNCTSTTPFQKQ